MLTVGEILKKERNNKNITLEEIEKATKIRKKNLENIEKSNWEAFSSKTYIIGVIKNYANFLDLKEEKLVAFFRREYEKKEEVKFNEGIKDNYLVPQTIRVFRFFLFIIALFFIIYFAYQIKIFFTPPLLEILSPKENQFKNTDKILLIGKTDKDTIINVNNDRVLLKSNNTFEVEIPLYNQKNPVIIEATGPNGKKTTINKIYERLSPLNP